MSDHKKQLETVFVDAGQGLLKAVENLVSPDKCEKVISMWEDIARLEISGQEFEAEILRRNLETDILRHGIAASNEMSMVIAGAFRGALAVGKMMLLA